MCGKMVRGWKRVRVKWLANDRPDYIHINVLNDGMIEGPMQHFNNNFRTIEKNNAQWSRQAHLFVGFCQIYTHSIQTHTYTHNNRWWNIKINDWKRQRRQRSTIVFEKERKKKKNNKRAHVCVHTYCLSVVCFLCPFLFHFAFILLNENDNKKR